MIRLLSGSLDDGGSLAFLLESLVKCRLLHLLLILRLHLALVVENRILDLFRRWILDPDCLLGFRLFLIVEPVAPVDAVWVVVSMDLKMRVVSLDCLVKLGVLLIPAVPHLGLSELSVHELGVVDLGPLSSRQAHRLDLSFVQRNLIEPFLCLSLSLRKLDIGVHTVFAPNRVFRQV